MSLSVHCSFNSEDSPCDNVGKGTDLMPIVAYTQDIKPLLKAIGASGRTGPVSEGDLILNRAGYFRVTPEQKATMTVCPKHRKLLTTDWAGRKKNKCAYPSHKAGRLKRPASKNPRRVNPSMSMEIYDIHHAVVPIGSAICTNCRKEHYKARNTHSNKEHPVYGATQEEAGVEEEVEEEELEESEDCLQSSQSSQSSQFAQFSHSSQSTHSSVPEEELSIWVDEIEEQNRKRQKLNEAVDFISGGRYSPVQSTMNTEWDDVSDTQQRYYLRKAKETIAASLSVLTPGQEELMWKSLQTEPLHDTSKRKRFDPSTGIIEVLIKAYDQADCWQTKRQILSLFANDFTRTELQEMIPGLSKWRIDQARLHATVTGKGQTLQERPIYRNKIDPVKVDHFIDYISRPEFIQDVAFGTKTLKLDSGERIIIPAVIRTLIPSRIIRQYMYYCTEQDFDPAGERSLYRMIEVCSASMQKSMHGLDNVTSEGAEAFDKISSIVEGLLEHGINTTTTQKLLTAGKRYLKTDYKTHVGKSEHCSDHCSVHALSDKSNPEFSAECNHDHQSECERCESLEQVLEDIVKMLEDVQISEEQKTRLRFEYSESVRDIKAWKAHLLRSYNQEEAKQDVLSKLGDESCLIVMDWAMKFLPLLYRERMSDFFGKRGRSWHVSAVITSQMDRVTHENKFEVECFVHIFNSCTQNSFAVLSIIENLLRTIKVEYPDINKAYFRSDNAGCYHNGALLLSLPELGVRTGVQPIRYDFSDPQAGKDICDRKTAPMKAHIRRWVNEKHDVTTAEEMKEALKSHGGIKGCRAAVVEVDTRNEVNKDSKIPGISILNNFLFEDAGIRAWKAYSIGPGCLMPYSLQTTPQGDTGLRVIQPFGPSMKERGTVGESIRSQAEIFSCRETGCILTFRSQSEVDKHMDIGKHRCELESESTYDKIRQKWANKMTGVTFADQPTSSRSAADEPQTSEFNESCRLRPLGWALKTVKKPSRMTKKVKEFLERKFNEGARSGQKAEPMQLSNKMKVATDEEGQLVFLPEEWRSAQQIASFFSRLTALQRQRGISEEDIAEDDIAAAESEVSHEALRTAVMDDMVFPCHPIVVCEKDLCELISSNKLRSLKLADLREVCERLELEAKGSLLRKKTYYEPIEQYAQSCSCTKGRA